jgi:segregation and condensation protein B
VSRPEVDAVRGVNSEGVLDNLLERRLVRIAGRKDTPGRPFLYETTRDFLVAFGLRDLADLPKPEGELVIPDVSAPDAPAQGELDKELAAATDPSQQDPGPGGAELAPRG